MCSSSIPLPNLRINCKNTCNITHHIPLYIGRVWSCVRNPNAASFYVGRLKFLEQQNKMGTAQMGPLIFSMALPAMISMIINALYNIVDSIFVIKYSQDALAAVSPPYIRCGCWSWRSVSAQAWA